MKFLDKIKIPFKKNKEFIETSDYILTQDGSSDFKEAYNSLVTNVVYSDKTVAVKKIAVTSANYGEGKSNLAINLAIALAHNFIDKKVRT